MNAAAYTKAAGLSALTSVDTFGRASPAGWPRSRRPLFALDSFAPSDSGDLTFLGFLDYFEGNFHDE